MNLRSDFTGFRPIRRDRLIQEAVHDPYQSKGKLHEPSVCPECGAVFHAGHWQWLERPKDAHPTSCPACRREHDHFPAGYLTLSGAFASSHSMEIEKLMRNHEAREKAEHPLQRIMAIEKTNEGTMITTTDIHLARGLGEALHHAYQGELEFHYNPDQMLLRVNWTRQ